MVRPSNEKRSRIYACTVKIDDDGCISEEKERKTEAEVNGQHQA